jgi:hypothetical protein
VSPASGLPAALVRLGGGPGSSSVRMPVRLTGDNNPGGAWARMALVTETSSPEPATPAASYDPLSSAAPRSPLTPAQRQDLEAVIGARRELGPEYDDALVASFLDKIDAQITERVRQEVAAQLEAQGGPKRSKDGGGLILALGSLGIAVPLTAIAAETAGPLGMFAAWAGIIAINVANALGRRRR